MCNERPAAVASILRSTCNDKGHTAASINGFRAVPDGPSWRPTHVPTSQLLALGTD